MLFLCLGGFFFSPKTQIRAASVENRERTLECSWMLDSGAGLNLEPGRAGKLQLHRWGSVEVHCADLFFFFFVLWQAVTRRMVI